jgi:chloride channel 7
MQNEERTKGYKFLVKKRFARWVVFFFIGVITALIACCIDIAIEELSAIKFYYLKHCKLSCSQIDLHYSLYVFLAVVDSCVNDHCMYIPYLFWISSNIIFVFIGTILVTYLEVLY